MSWGQIYVWVVVFAVAGLLVFLARLGNARRRVNPIELPSHEGNLFCGNCRYDVRNLPTPICPECGSDLLVVGYYTPRYNRWQAVPRLGRGIIFTVFCVLSFLWLIVVQSAQVDFDYTGRDWRGREFRVEATIAAMVFIGLATWVGGLVFVLRARPVVRQAATPPPLPTREAIELQMRQAAGDMVDAEIVEP